MAKLKFAEINRFVCNRSHPLMDSAVRHEGDAPAFYKRDLVLTTLVVDKQFVDMLGDDITYTVFYAGTSKSNKPIGSFFFALFYKLTCTS